MKNPHETNESDVRDTMSFQVTKAFESTVSKLQYLRTHQQFLTPNQLERLKEEVEKCLLEFP